MKRLFDIAVSAMALILLTPILLLVAIVSRLKLGPGVIFSQTRIGLNDCQFRLFKFRTMLNTRDEHGVLLPDHVRLTPYGRFLRSTSLDELPGLWNVLIGDMSLVGPRPLLVQYLDRYTPTQRRRHSVRPGITGLAQSKGRNSLSWEDRLAWDVRYVDTHSFVGDLRILLDTVSIVLLRRGISGDGSATMTEFMGSLGSNGSVDTSQRSDTTHSEAADATNQAVHG